MPGNPKPSPSRTIPIRNLAQLPLRRLGEVLRNAYCFAFGTVRGRTVRLVTQPNVVPWMIALINTHKSLN